MHWSNMALAAKEEEVCAFCGHGADVEEDCGKLHCHKGVLFAHHKCMQYSSGLTQYTFEHFGGFDVTEVENEIKRGRKLVCSWCRKVKMKGGHTTSATAGCMLSQCHKTFHFLCARLHATTSRRRLRTTKGEVDLYRTFCSRKHKKKYHRSGDATHEYSCNETDEEHDGVGSSRRSNRFTDSDSTEVDDDATDKDSSDNSDDDETEIEDNVSQEVASVCKTSVSLKKEWLSSEIPRGAMDCVVILTSLECTAYMQGRLQLQDNGSYKILKTERSINHVRNIRTSKKKVLWKSSPESCTESRSLKLKLKKESISEIYTRCSRKPIPKRTRKSTRSKRKMSESNDDTDSDPSWTLPGSQGKRSKGRYADITSPESSGAMFSSDSSDFDLPISFPELNQKIKRTSKKAFSTYRRIQTPRMSSSDSDASSDRKGSSPEMSKEAVVSSAVGLQALEGPVSLSGVQLPSDRIMEQIRAVPGISSETNNMIDSSDMEDLHLPAFAAAFGKPKKNASQDAAALGYSNKNYPQQSDHRESGTLMPPYGHENAREEKDHFPESSRSRKRRHEDIGENERDMSPFQNPDAEHSNSDFQYFQDEFRTVGIKKELNPLHVSYVDRLQEQQDNFNHHSQNESAARGEEKNYYEGENGENEDSVGLKNQPDTSQTERQWSTVNEITIDDSVNLLTVQSMSEDLIKKNEAIGSQHRLSEEESTATECVLVIPADAKRFENVAFDVQLKVAEELGFEEKHIYMWTAVTPILLPASCMLLYFRDLVTALQNQDWTWLRQLLTDSDTLKMKHDMEYAPKTRRHKNLVNSVQKEQEITKLVESVVQGLNTACDQSGDFVGMFTTSHGVNYLFLIINHFSDQHQLLRKALHQRLAMYQWREGEVAFSSFEGVPAKRLQGHHLQESFILRKWFTTNFHQISKVILLPEEELLLSSDPTCSTDSNCFSQLKCRMEECEMSSAQVYKSDLPLVVFIRKMDRNIVCFERYLQACLKKYSRDFENRRVTCIFHVDNLNTKKCPRLDLGGTDCSIKFYSAFSPFERPVSLVIVDVVRDWI